MANETTKTKQLFGDLEKRIFENKKGIDIGCGPDPIFSNVKPFDMSDGDANDITKYVKEKYDFVFSSHCLEHMHNPYHALSQWWKLVKEGGYMYVLIPDEDLYEQGVFPSRFNSDHKRTFTIYKKKSWSHKSVNVIDLIKSLPDVKILKLELQDKNYDYSFLKNHSGKDQTLDNAMAQICFILQKEKAIKYPKVKFKPMKHKNHFDKKLFGFEKVIKGNIKRKYIILFGIKIRFKKRKMKG